MSRGRTDEAKSQFQMELSAAQTLCEIVDTPRSLAVSMMAEAGEWEQLLNLRINPLSYHVVGDFADDYLVTEVLKKSASLPTGIDRTAVATAKFYEAEKCCWETNHRLFIEDHPKWWSRFRANVHSILGSLRQTDLQRLPSLFRNGPGATTSVRGRGSVSSEKYGGEIHLTTNLMSFLRSIQGELWWETSKSCPKTVVEGNRFTTVPKNAKTDRGICIEPGLNIYFQLGIGALMRSRLKRSGLDLNRQAVVNRQLAGEAYTRKLATIDLSMASDTMSAVLINQVLPFRWAHLLNLARSPSTYVEDR